MKNSKSFQIYVEGVSAKKLKNQFDDFTSSSNLKLQVVKKKKKGKRDSGFLEAFTIGAVSVNVLSSFLYGILEWSFKKSKEHFSMDDDASSAIVRLKSGIEIKIPANTKKKKLKKIVKNIFELGEIESVTYQ